MFVFECLCSAEDVQGYINMHHKRFRRKHTHTSSKKEGEEKAMQRYQILFRIPFHVPFVRRGEGSADY